MSIADSCLKSGEEKAVSLKLIEKIEFLVCFQAFFFSIFQHLFFSCLNQSKEDLNYKFYLLNFDSYYVLRFPRKNFKVNFHLILGHFARKILKKPGNRGIFRDLDGKKVEKLVFFTWKRDSRCPFSRHQEKKQTFFLAENNFFNGNRGNYR